MKLFYFKIFLIFFQFNLFCLGVYANPNSIVALDVNDVSFLFPLKGEKPFPAISISDDLHLPKNIFEKVLRFEDKTLKMDHLPYLDGKYLGDIHRWYVTSYRFDPCGEVFNLTESIDPNNDEAIWIADRKTGCQARLRIVAQPFNIFGNPVATALHLIYKIDQTEVKNLVNSLMKIKKLSKTELSLETSGLPLMQHPALVMESESSDKNLVAEAVRSALLTALNGPAFKGTTERLEIVTLSLQVVIDKWRFVGGYISNGSWQRFVTKFSNQFNVVSDKSIGLGVEELECNGNSICLYRPSYQPKSLETSGLVLTQIFRDIPEMKALQVPGFRSEKIQIDSETIDNSLKTHFFNTNCVSCHSSSNLRDPNAIHTDLNLPTGVTPFVPKKYLSGLTNNIINFGYWGSVPRISNRTASDSANVAAAINQYLEVDNPSNSILDLKLFWSCLTNSTEYLKCLTK